MTEYYKQQLEKGLLYQDFVVEKMYGIGLPVISYSSKKYQCGVGENKGGFEIKFDDRLKDTGNLYIEISEKSNPNNVNFISSGIFRNDNTWLYVIGNYDIIYMLGKIHLIHIYDKLESYKAMRRVATKTSKGFLMPAKYAENCLAVKVIKCKGDKLI